MLALAQNIVGTIGSCLMRSPEIKEKIKIKINFKLKLVSNIIDIKKQNNPRQWRQKLDANWQAHQSFTSNKVMNRVIDPRRIDV